MGLQWGGGAPCSKLPRVAPRLMVLKAQLRGLVACVHPCVGSS